MISLLAKQLLTDALQHLPNVNTHTAKQLSDIQATLQKQLELGLKKANLVSRAEFDIQAEVLQRTEQQLKTVEEALKKLEEKVSHL